MAVPLRSARKRFKLLRNSAEVSQKRSRLFKSNPWIRFGVAHPRLMYGFDATKSSSHGTCSVVLKFTQKSQGLLYL